MKAGCYFRGISIQSQVAPTYSEGLRPFERKARARAAETSGRAGRRPASPRPDGPRPAAKTDYPPGRAPQEPPGRAPLGPTICRAGKQGSASDLFFKVCGFSHRPRPRAADLQNRSALPTTGLCSAAVPAAFSGAGKMPALRELGAPARLRCRGLVPRRGGPAWPSRLIRAVETFRWNVSGHGDGPPGRLYRPRGSTVKESVSKLGISRCSGAL